MNFASPSPPAKKSSSGTAEFDLVRGDPWSRLEQRLHTLPSSGKDGVFRRILIFTTLAWVPLMIWAWATGHLFYAETGEPLMRHFDIHSRFLFALPVLIFAERLCRAAMKRLLPRFVAMGLVPEEKVPQLGDVIAGIVRLRNATLPWIAIAAVILLWILVPQTGHRLEELNWAIDHNELGFGGWWYLCVSRPIFQVFLFGWLWRIVILAVLLKRILKLGIRIVPPHPDRLGGLGFIEGFPTIFAPLAFACSCVLASKWAHEVTWHGVHVQSFRMQAIIYIILMLVLCVSPLLVFIPFLRKAKRKAVAEYSQLIARHGRLVHEEWMEGKPVTDRSLLEAPELGPTCDIGAIFDAVKSMRIVPFTKKSLLAVALPAALPLLAVFLMEIPIGELVGKILKALL